MIAWERRGPDTLQRNAEAQADATTRMLRTTKIIEQQQQELALTR